VKNLQSANILSAQGLRDLAAMNACTYAMTPEERDRWFRDHPLSDFEEPDAAPGERR
jgi:hypothetical protein